MAIGAPGILTADVTPEAARRGWPRWVLLGLAMLAVAVLALVRVDLGPQLLLGSAAVFLVVRGLTLLRLAKAGTWAADVTGRAVWLGVGCIIAGPWLLVTAVLSMVLFPRLAGWVLLVAVPLVFVAVGLGLVARGGLVRRGGQALLVWAALAGALLVLTWLGQGVERAASAATVLAALGIAVLAVAVLIGALNLRAAGVRAEAEPPPPTGCGGCTGGGCGSAQL